MATYPDGAHWPALHALVDRLLSASELTLVSWPAR